jgi:hypothetical protein
MIALPSPLFLLIPAFILLVSLGLPAWEAWRSARNV